MNHDVHMTFHIRNIFCRLFGESFLRVYLINALNRPSKAIALGMKVNQVHCFDLKMIKWWPKNKVLVNEMTRSFDFKIEEHPLYL